MKVIVDRTPLHKALQACSVVTDRSNSAPILQGVRVSTAGKGALWVVATDLNLTLRLSVAATVHGGGEFVVNLQALTDFVRNLPDETVHLTHDDGALLIESGTTKFKVPVLSAQDFPTLPECEDDAPSFETDMSILADGYAAVSYAIGDGVRQADDGSVLAKGVSVSNSDRGLEFCATTGIVLALARFAPSSTETVADVTPREAIAAFMKLREPEACRFRRGTNHVFVEFGEDSFFAYRRYDIPFPNYAAAMAKYSALTAVAITLNRKRLLEAIQRALLLNPGDRGVVIEAKAGRLTTKPLREERGDGGDAMPYDVGYGAIDDLEMRIVVHGGHITQALSSVTTESVTLAQDGRIVVIRSVSDDLDGPTSMHCQALRLNF